MRATAISSTVAVPVSMERIEPSSPLPEVMVQLLTSRNLAMPHQSSPPTRCHATSAGLLIAALKERVVQAAG